MARIRHRNSLYGISAVDDRGRMVARYLISGLRWEPGLPLAIAERAGLLVITPCESGLMRLTPAGHLRLPATLRHWYGLDTGTRALLVAEPGDSRLVIHPPASLDEMITQTYAALF